MDAPPIVDVEPLVADDVASAPVATVGAHMHAACLETGFFVAVGHGLDAELAAVDAAARSFFAGPQADKERTPRRNRYGYVPHADLALDRDRETGRTEYLELGLGDEVPMPDVTGFATAIRAYQAATLELARRILTRLAIELGAEPDAFTASMTDPQCRLRLLHYLPTPPGPDGAPVLTPPHTDYGAITVLATDGVPGLEVRPIGGTWTPVVAPAGSFVVNLGDMLARWTNDVYRSTQHRVVGQADRHRLSIPFFVNPDPDAIVSCLPACVTDDRPCRYAPIPAGEYLRRRIDGTEEPYVDLT